MLNVNAANMRSGQLISKALEKKWQSIVEHKSLPEIKDSWRKQCTAVLLENQQADRSSAAMNLMEASPVTAMGASSSTAGTGPIDTWDPILISMVRRQAPMFIAYDIAGVQPMSGPTGLIFALRSVYVDPDSPQGDKRDMDEAFFNEANSAFSGLSTTADPGDTGFSADAGGSNFAANVDAVGVDLGFGYGTGMSRTNAESLGYDNTNHFNQMSITIDKVLAEAKSRALKAEYTTEMAQDLMSVHGLDVETELSNILTTEVLIEQNRELIRTIYYNAKMGAQKNTAEEGVYNLDTDANGRWSVERFKGLMYQIEREANAINRTTRRGKGNIIVASSDVVSALQMTGLLDDNPRLPNDLQVDESQSTFAGMINGRTKVFIDPYFSNESYEYCTVGYRGTLPFDAGIFYCPYVPLQMVRAVSEDGFQPKIGFKTRYAVVANPFVPKADGTRGDGAIRANVNPYYRRFMIKNLM